MFILKMGKFHQIFLKLKENYLMQQWISEMSGNDRQKTLVHSEIDKPLVVD